MERPHIQTICCALVAIAMLVGTVQASQHATDTGPPAPSQMVAVLPFINLSRAAADRWIGDGIAETLASDLQRAPGVTVLSREVFGTARRASADVDLDMVNENDGGAALSRTRRDLAHHRRLSAGGRSPEDHRSTGRGRHRQGRPHVQGGRPHRRAVRPAGSGGRPAGRAARRRRRAIRTGGAGRGARSARGSGIGRLGSGNPIGRSGRRVCRGHPGDHRWTTASATSGHHDA